MQLADLNYKDLLILCQKDKELGKEYFKKIFNKFLKNYSELIVENPLSLLMGFYPLPNQFNICILNSDDLIEKRGDYYFFAGRPGNRILFGHRRLPVINKDPIPFMFPITKNNKTKPILSDTFYFEVQIQNKQFRKGWHNECLSIGFGSVNTSYKNQVGWSQKSWGFHSDDGHYVTNNIGIEHCERWEKGDTMGVGLKYISINNYKIFLTKNGLMINDEISFTCDEMIVPMMGLDLSYPVKVNWGQNEFEFDLEKYIDYSQILSIKNNFLSNNECIDEYKVIPKLIPKIYHSKLINLPHGLHKYWNLLGISHMTNDISGSLLDISKNLLSINSLNNILTNTNYISDISNNYNSDDSNNLLSNLFNNYNLDTSGNYTSSHPLMIKMSTTSSYLENIPTSNITTSSYLENIPISNITTTSYVQNITTTNSNYTAFSPIYSVFDISNGTVKW